MSTDAVNTINEVALEATLRARALRYQFGSQAAAIDEARNRLIELTKYNADEFIRNVYAEAISRLHSGNF